MDYFKQKLKNILHHTQFCGICLEYDNNMTMIDENMEIVINEQTHSKSLQAIIRVVFENPASILASSQICNSCTEKLIQSYIFIRNAKETSKIIGNYLDDLFCKSGDIFMHLSDIESSKDNIASSNVVIVLEKNNMSNLLIKEEKLKRERVEKDEDIVEKNYTELSEVTKRFQCKICSKTFRIERLLTEHYKLHSKIKCRTCHGIFKSGDILDHLQKCNKSSIQTCMKCHDIFYSVSALKSHDKYCHTETVPKCLVCLKDDVGGHKCKFGCTECSESPCRHYKYLVSYREQILSNFSRVKCLDCDYTCRRKEMLLGHVNRKHLNHHPYYCDKCGQHFYSKVILKAHFHRFHEEVYVCEYCNFEFSSQNAWESHIKVCGKTDRKVSCNDCTASFDSSEKLTAHKRSKHCGDIFPCGLCNKQFLKESKRKEHMVKVHGSLRTITRTNTTQCIICLDKFETKGDLVQHMKSHGPSVKYPCRICNTEYETLRQYTAHNRKHLGPFATCEVCGKEMRQILLKKHMTTHNTTIVTCETCGKSFQNVALLKYHQKVHLESVPCPKCKKLFNPARLRRHYKRHILEENPELRVKKQSPHLKCEQCDYKTWNHILLECHMNRHHLKIKPYVCHICSKDFIGKHLLKKHIDTHSIDKSVTCMVCLKSFANPACLKMHLRLHTGEKPFTCEICGDRFRSSSIMNVHKLKKHSDKRSCCPLCPNKFYTVRDLRRHVITVHWKQKDKKFNPRELKGLEQHYHLFHDGRRVKVAEEDVSFYMPCVT